MKLRSFLIIVFFINILQSIYTPIIDDEAYYWLWSLKIDAGYFDHPPLIALWVKLSNLMFDGELGVRFFTVCCNTISAYLFWLLLKPKTNREFKLFLMVYFSLLFVQLFSFVSTPDAPLLFFTLAYLNILKLFIAKQNWITTILLGTCFAGLMYSKYQGILVLVFTLLPIITFLYRKYQFYVAVIFSLILYLPHFYWLHLYNYPPIYYHFIDRNSENNFYFFQPILYILTAITCASGLLFPFLIKGLKDVDQNNLFKRAVFWLIIGPFFFFLIATFKSKVQAQWLLVSYIASGLVIYWYVVNKENLNKFYFASYLTIGLIFFARIIVVIPSLSPLFETKRFAENLNNLPTKIVVFEKYQEAAIYQFYYPDHQAVVYRTLGNRNSQFTIWDSETDLSQSFTYVSPWLKSNQSFKGIKHLTYYINYINGYTPIHKSKADFLKLDEALITDEVIVNPTQENIFTISINAIDFNLLKNKKYRLVCFVTKDKQHNIVEEIEIPITALVSHQKGNFYFKFKFKHHLQQGNYVAYIGVIPYNLVPKYQSKPLKIIISE